MNFNHQSVSSCSNSRLGKGSNVVTDTGSMAGIYDNGQMGPLAKNRNGADVQGVSCGGFVGADSPFAEDNIVIAF